MDKIALGLSKDLPIFDHAIVHELVRRAFIGLPWPKKIVGMRVFMKGNLHFTVTNRTPRCNCSYALCTRTPRRSAALRADATNLVAFHLHARRC